MLPLHSNVKLELFKFYFFDCFSIGHGNDIGIEGLAAILEAVTKSKSLRKLS